MFSWLALDTEHKTVGRWISEKILIFFILFGYLYEHKALSKKMISWSHKKPWTKMYGTVFKHFPRFLPQIECQPYYFQNILQRYVICTFNVYISFITLEYILDYILLNQRQATWCCDTKIEMDKKKQDICMYIYIIYISARFEF